MESSGAPGHKSIDCTAAKLKRSASSGKSALLALVLVALIAIGALAWLHFGRSTPVQGDIQLPPAAVQGDQSSTSAPSAPIAVATPMEIQPALEVGRSEKLPRPVPQAFDESRLNGRGHIRGFVQTPKGIEFPQEWVLSVQPSTSLIGHDHAETRRLEFHAGEQEFDLQNLALGGYMLRASAFGLSSAEQHLLLAKPSESDLMVSMQLEVTSFIEGSVRYEDFAPAIGLELALEPRPSGVRVITTTNAIGHFLFTDVKSGGYTLYFGKPQTPVRESLEVNVGTSPEHLPDAIVPKMGELLVRVFLAPGSPAKGVKLDGYGDKGGNIEGETNADGEYRAKFLPAGRITVNALFPDGSRVRGRQVIGVGGVESLDLVLRK